MDDSTFIARAVIGVGLLAILVLREHLGDSADRRRLKEYGFLFSSAGLGIAYAIVHDVFTYRLSREYFTVGKGLSGAADGFWPQVAWLAARAGWSGGLVVGVGLLLANNPHPQLRQLPYAQLWRALCWPLAIMPLTATTLGLLGPVVLPSLVGASTLAHLGVADPSVFLRVWGIHVGTYLGAAAGLAAAALTVRGQRKVVLAGVC